VGRTGVRICLMLRERTRVRISSLPVSINSFNTFSVSLPACKVLMVKMVMVQAFLVPQKEFDEDGIGDGGEVAKAGDVKQRGVNGERE
jgi:hypothetical protein